MTSLKFGLATASLLFAHGRGVWAQVPSHVDFKRDVQPIFQQYCIECHGPSQQLSGFRLDRRTDAMRGGGGVDIGPASSGSSRLYLRLIGARFGLQMPPARPLAAGQIAIIKAWIDRGAEWPDDASGEGPAPLTDPKATRLMQALRNGDRQLFQKILRESPAVVNGKGPGGSTPLMYAALYGDPASIRLLLQSGADPNLKNDALATALMWAVDDAEKTGLLVEHGADVNARSAEGITPLIVAAGWFGSSPVLKLLLDHGANPSAASPLGITALAEASVFGDARAMKLLLDRGADRKGAGSEPLAFALRAQCALCVEMLIGSADRNALSGLIGSLMPPELGDGQDTRSVRMLLDRGADAEGVAEFGGLTPLIRAASSDRVPIETVKVLLEHNSDVNAKGDNGETALGMAPLRGKTPLTELLRKASGKETNVPSEPALKPIPAASARAAVERSIPLLQRAGVNFLERSGCVSCHNNALTVMALAAAKKNGIPIDEWIAQQQLTRIDAYLGAWRERTLQGLPIQGLWPPVAYILVGLAAGNYPPDETTDAMARFLKSKQMPDGRWFDMRTGHRSTLATSESPHEPSAHFRCTRRDRSGQSMTRRFGSLPHG